VTSWRGRWTALTKNLSEQHLLGHVPASPDGQAAVMW
jgi:hypothetical protein